mgnify:CR=1 FL=1
MSNKAASTATSTTDRKTRPRRQRRTYTALEKCRAVLAVWTEARTASEMARDLQTTWTQLNAWQKQALDGMLQALEDRRRKRPRSAALNGRLQRLLEKRGLAEEASETVAPALRKRLAEVAKKREGTV